MADIVFTYNGKRISPSSGKVLGRSVDPYNPLNLPDYTVRLKFRDGYTPAMGDSQTLVDAATNVWDITKNSASWSSLFASSNIIEVLGANSTGVTNMSQMFRSCNRLESVSLFDTSSVTDMSQMFQGCNPLTAVPLFDTSSVTNMKDLFRDCRNLQSVPLFDTGSVTNMTDMFQYCYALTSVPLFDTSSVTTMDRMFQYCTSLTSVPLFDTGSVTDMSSMLSGCTLLTSIPLFDTGSVMAMNQTFYNCKAVESGALALYTQASTQATPPSSYMSCFTNCGSDTTTGAAELSQIPTSWGGTMA